jgi:hypothetical protein
MENTTLERSRRRPRIHSRFLGMAILIAVDDLCAALNGVAFFIVAHRTGRPLHLGSIGLTIRLNAPLLSTSLGIGRMLARWAPGRELVACLIYAMLLSTWNLVPIPISDDRLLATASPAASVSRLGGGELNDPAGQEPAVNVRDISIRDISMHLWQYSTSKLATYTSRKMKTLVD